MAALEWVRRNVEAFGGDPLNVRAAGRQAGGDARMRHQGLMMPAMCAWQVTLYGESAGAISCTVLAAAGYANKWVH